ncbi:MAG: carboxypeptidase M32, partial [Pseudomonadota bacterium]
LDDVQTANLRLIRRAYDRDSKVPAKLAEDLARTTARAQGVWAAARKANRFEDFALELKTIIALKREEAAAIAAPGQSTYDALLADFEPGMTVDVLSPLLEGMRPRLSALRQTIAESGRQAPEMSGTFPTGGQMELARLMALNAGYDFEAGRLDLSVHPFSSGTMDDSRITTRLDEADPLGCLYSTQHEVGHALYEQGLPREHVLTPVGTHVSMGVHESQSRLWENQIGRSHAYCRWLFPHFEEHLGNGGLVDEDAFHATINRVETGFIRTEADEVHYNLHVLLRFELERDLISGTLEVDDLEAAWNERFERDFGLAVPDAAHGVLQDVHWSVGLFGYFPTYSLGNIYAAQLNLALRETVPDLDEQIAAGDTSAILAFLRERVHSKGSLLEPADLMEQASGQRVSSEPLLDYLEAKYSTLYGLSL